MDKIKVIEGDITELEVDAIVNAANSSLMGGGGVDGAIHDVGGPQILEDCIEIRKKQGPLPTGEAVITRAGDLPAKCVIHTVGPVWRNGIDDEEMKLACCYRNSLRVAVENGCKTVAFPNISTGIFGYPRDKAAIVAFETVKDFLREHNEVEEVIFCCFDAYNYHLMTKLLG